MLISLYRIQITCISGDALTGDCAISTIDPGKYPFPETNPTGNVTMGDSDGNACTDITAIEGTGTAQLLGYELDPIVFPCLDSDYDGLME